MNPYGRKLSAEIRWSGPDRLADGEAKQEDDQHGGQNVEHCDPDAHGDPASQATSGANEIRDNDHFAMARSKRVQHTIPEGQ